MLCPLHVPLSYKAKAMTGGHLSSGGLGDMSLGKGHAKILGKKLLSKLPLQHL